MLQVNGSSYCRRKFCNIQMASDFTSHPYHVTVALIKYIFCTLQTLKLEIFSFEMNLRSSERAPWPHVSDINEAGTTNVPSV